MSGQSNAWAIDYDNAYNDIDLPVDAQWVRTIGAMHVYNKSAIFPEAANTDWYIASGKAPDIRDGSQFVGNGVVGVLGMNIALNLVASEGLPIAIINGAGGGGAISFYQKTKDYDLDVPYGRLQYRLEASGLKNHIKAFIWNQGENNAGDSVIGYKTALNQLYNNFKNDYRFEKFYIIQTPPGCNSKTGHQTVREAQRQFSREQQDVKILTRHGFPKNTKTTEGNYFLSDGCHYHSHGYEVLGNWIAKLAQFDFYGSSIDYQAPQLVGVTLKASNVLSIEFDKAIAIQPDVIVDGVSYTLKDNAFAIDNRRVTTISHLNIDSKNPKKLHLKFKNQKLSKGNIFTYILEDTYLKTSLPFIGPWLIDAYTGVGAVGFSKAVE